MEWIARSLAATFSTAPPQSSQPLLYPAARSPAAADRRKRGTPATRPSAPASAEAIRARTKWRTNWRGGDDRIGALFKMFTKRGPTSTI
ncbi:uncharacterized protein METZ01_LOCUS82977 [marine metagenome]|uniref:Uncharacterized protein n=1 Tax=marine metagenome TaxID=408172 RepID=A0A381UTC7_9ZZZZ